MKKIKNKLVELWNAETPKIARMLQWVSGVIAAGTTAVITLWGTLPEEFKSTVPDALKQHMVYVAAVGVLVPVLLQFSRKKGGGR